MSTTVTTRILHTSTNAKPTAVQQSWVWPLPRLDGVAPSIIESTPGRSSPGGVALGYRERSSSPGLVPVFAARDGIVTYAGNAADGPTVCIDHAGGWSTQYSELQHLLTRPTDRFRRRRKERVRAGDVIGHACRSTLRIRFGLSRLIDEASVEQDPASWMPAWSMLPWFAESVSAAVTPAAV
jgi:hypothetical protein